MHRVPVVAIVGRPNVGKSALFNRLVGRRIAIVEDIPGVTRDRLSALVEWGGRRFEVVDTGGWVSAPEDRIAERVRAAAQAAAQEADVVLFVVDGRAGLVPEDAQIARSLRGAQRPVILVVNKVDQPDREDVLTAEFHALGFPEVVGVSALHGYGIGELLDRVVARLPEGREHTPLEEGIPVAFVGRPNVGKSSLVNALVGMDRVLVDEAPGTTRDAVDVVLRTDGRTFVLVDTAGLRRRARIRDVLEFYGTTRTRRALERAHVAVLVLDATEGPVDQDQRIAQEVVEAGRALVVAVNKWDLVPPENATNLARQVHEALRHVHFAPVVFTSAKTGRNVRRILDLVVRADASHALRIPTGPLNRAIARAVREAHPPTDASGRPLKIYYATQVAVRPPTLVLFVNDPGLGDEPYLRYLEGRLRASFDLVGTPLRIHLRSRR
ncbi:MAG: ribosome biogenesis GTPase Der [Armatimonadota bacterium]|nr:ribosome biogenesis GTPase Der [Armatimonadota bacterium]MDR7445222.1 ribosome biogenesis GTPase Der [Armatimonadota bacterium]MDR7615517.1 ribosome biogenesis GTPase Der [Armatimonadota bacterium]